MSQSIITIELHTLRSWMLKKSKQERLNGDYCKADHTLKLRQAITKEAQKQHEKIKLLMPQSGMHYAQNATKDIA